jgi:hypothetical protein
MDFYHVKPVLEGPGKNWSFMDGTADDGLLNADCYGLTIDSVPFKKSSLSDLRTADHLKYFIYANQPVAIPKDGKVVVEFEGSAETKGTDQNNYPDGIVQINDLRLAYGIFSTFDPATGLAFSFVLTNNRVYAIYQCQPVTTSSTYAKFIYAVPVKMRKSCDFHRMKFVFSEIDKSIGYRLDGREVLRIKYPGYRLDKSYMIMDEGGNEELKFPAAVYYGLGTGDLLDAYPACQRSDVCFDCRYPADRMALANTGTQVSQSTLSQFNTILGDIAGVYWFPFSTDPVSPANRALYYLWGQGAILRATKLIVYQQRCFDDCQ